MANCKFYPPFIVIPMPLNKDGKGPECNEKLVTEIVYEIWDSINQTVKSFSDENLANKLCVRLNQKHHATSVELIEKWEVNFDGIIN